MNISKQEIIDELKNEILTLQLKPGTIVSEATLTNKYRLSRTPIRDILKQLAQDGYINIYPQRGSKVSFIDLKSVEQVTFLRSTLEKEIIKDLCNKSPNVNIDKLQEIVKDQKLSINSDDPFTKFMELDDKFHELLFVIADRVFLWEIIQKLNVHYVRYRKLHMLKIDKLKTLYKEHKEITDCINNGDATAVDSIIHKHIRGDVNSDYFLKNYPEYIILR